MARPRGFAEWSPRADTLALLDDVNSVLHDLRDHLPLTARQVFYRLVGAYGFDKTERAYSRLCEHIVRARRAGMIDFDAIRDDGTSGGYPQTFADVAAFWRNVQSDVDHYSRDRLTGQDVRIELWCEAQGMVPQLQRVAFRYSVPVFSTGGFSSVTVTREIAQRALWADVDTVFLHCGDFDPSGQSIFDAMAEDAGAFVGQSVRWRGQSIGKTRLRHCADVALRPERVALRAEQVELYDLPTAPPKASDSRTRNWDGDTCQLEALPPDTLATIVRESIESHLDLDVFRAERDLEEADRESINETLTNILGEE